METPPNIPEVFEPETDKARGIVDQALSEGREWLTETEAKTVLVSYKIPVVRTFEAATAEQAAEIAASLGESVALKILSPDITHKSDVGGVAAENVGNQFPGGLGHGQPQGVVSRGNHKVPQPRRRVDNGKTVVGHGPPAAPLFLNTVLNR